MASEQTLIKHKQPSSTSVTREAGEVSSVKAQIETLTELLSQLVRFPTMTADHAANRLAIDWVEHQLAGLPLYITRYESNDHPMLIATTKKDSKNPKLWLTGHMDVVFAPPESFEPMVKDGRLHGRGAHDMKSGIAVFIALLQALGQDLSAYDLGLMITSDEEVGGYDGVNWLLDTHGYKGKVALIPDSGASWTMEMGAKGLYWWELIATGRSAHAGRLWHGENAIEKITQFIDQLRTHIPTEPCGDPDHQHATLNLAALNGETTINQVPEKATARIDFRYTADTSPETIIGWLDEAAAKVHGIETVLQFSDVPYRVKDEGMVHRFREFVQEVTGHDVTLANSHGSSDARHFAHKDIPTITISPKGSGFHVPEEWVDLEDLAQFYEVVRRFVEDTTKLR